MVDPRLVSEGEQLEGEGRRRGFRLGEYEVERASLVRGPAPGQSTLAPMHEPVRSAERVAIEVRVRKAERESTARCEGLRQPTLHTDYDALADEPRDAVAVHCELVDGVGGRWRFDARGRLSDNIGGTLEPVEDRGRALAVELLLWRYRFDRIRRPLVLPVAQVRMGKAAIAAMVLGSPERAWLASDAPRAVQEVAVTMMAALHLMEITSDT